MDVSTVILKKGGTAKENFRSYGLVNVLEDEVLTYILIKNNDNSLLALASLVHYGEATKKDFGVVFSGARLT